MSFRSGSDHGSNDARSDVNDARLNQGADLLTRNKPDTAEQSFRAVIESFPESAVAHALLAMALADQNRGHESLRSANEAVGLNPNLALAPTDPNRHSDLAGIVGRAGRYGEALDITARGLSLNPQHLPSLHCRALALVSLRRVDEAQEVLTSALLEDPDLAQLHASIGLALENQGEIARAADEFREAIRLDNSVMAAHEGLQRLNSPYRKLLPVNWRKWGR